MAPVVEETTEDAPIVPVPGQVIDLRGSATRGKPVKEKTQPRPTQPLSEIEVPEVGGVIDVRAKKKESTSKEERRDSRPPRENRAPRSNDRKRDSEREPRRDTRREKPPAKDITVVIMGIQGGMDNAGAIVDQIHSQRIPWEVEVLVMAPKGRFDFPNTRIFKPRNVNKPLDVMDYAIQRSNSDIVVFLNGNTIPQGDKWLLSITDPMFEESSVGIVDCPALASEEGLSSISSKTFHRHDSGNGSANLDGKAFAVRKSVALKNAFDAGEQTLEDWVQRVLSSGFTRRLEASVWVQEVEGSSMEAPAPKPEAKKARPARKATPKKEAPKRKKVVPPTPAMQPESAPPLWQLPMMIGQKTAEKYLQIAMDKKQRTVSSVVLAPVNATREVLSTYRKGGLPIPSILTKDD